MRSSALFGAKILDISKFVVCPHGQGGRTTAGIFRTRKEGVNISKFCADDCYGRSLIVVEKEQNVPISYFKLCSFVDRGEKYYLPSGTTGYSSCATERWGIRFRPQTPLTSGGCHKISNLLTVKCWLRV